MFAVVGHFGQKIEKPTLTAKPLTDHQRSLIEEGVGLHKQKKFDTAILKYELVLSENPDATVAMYEKALSLYTKGEKEKAIETAVLGSNIGQKNCRCLFSYRECDRRRGKPRKPLRYIATQ